MFTVDDEIGRDATELFNYLTGFSNQKDYRKLMVAPVACANKLNALFDREIEHKRAWQTGAHHREVQPARRSADRREALRGFASRREG